MDNVNNIYQLLAIVIPSIIAAVSAYYSKKNSTLIDKGNIKLDNIDRSLIDAKQAELIKSGEMSNIAQGMLEGLHKERELTIKKIINELVINKLIVEGKEQQIIDIINSAMLVKDKLIEEFVLVKEKAQQDLEVIRIKLIQELGKE